ncbi:MAG: c-type cytochrome, partial [Burkholderiales bacterium]
EPVSSTYAYLLGCETTHEAVLIDPVMPTWERDLSVLSELALKLTFTVETHIHADHITSALHFAATERRIRYAGLSGYALAALLLVLSSATPARAAQSVPAGEAGARVAAGLPACVQCHGASGEGQPASGFPRLAGQGKPYLIKQLQDFRAGRRKSPIMEPIAKSLDDAAVESMSAFYQGVVLPQAAADVRDAKAAAAVVGAKLATHGNWDKDVPACFACHGAGGAGIAPHFPAIARQNAAYTASQLRAWKSGARLNDPQGLMKAVADRLSDADIDAVAGYLESPRARGK